MKRNKFYSFLLITFLSLFAQSQLFAQTVTLKVQSIEASAGNTVSINVDVESSVPVYSVAFDLALPTGAVFQANSDDNYGTISSARKPKSCMQQDIKKADNKVTFGLVSTTQVQGLSGTLVTFKAKLPSNMALGSYPIEISNAMVTSADDDLSDKAKLTNGKLTIVKQTYTVKAVAGQHGSVSLTPQAAGDKYEVGAELTLVALADEGYEFAGWSDGSKDNPRKVKVSSNATYTASFSAKIYKVNFIIDGKTTTKEVAYGSAIQAPAPTKEGYTFTGWDKAIPSTMPASDLTFTAQWKVNSYTLTFNTGSQTLTSQVAYGSAVQAPAAPTKEGYTFTGWDKTVPATMPAGDLTFTAQWKVNGYTLTFVVGDKTESATVNYGAKVTAPSSPAKEGHTFTGWDKEVPATMPAGDLTITAQWQINSYKLTFDDGTASTTTEVVFGTAIETPADPEKDGYVFRGWDEKIPETMPARDLVFTAQWLAKNYRLVLQLGDVTTTYQFACGSQVAVPANVTRKGYTFAGWDVEVPAIMPAGDVTLTAQWQASVYKVTYKDGLEQQTFDVACGAEVPMPEEMQREGYVFKGWSPRVPTVMPAGDLAFEAQWQACQYPVLFLSKDAVVSEQMLDFGSVIEAPADPVLEGYEFSGWDPTFVSGCTVPVGGVIYKAVYKVNPYRITYMVDGAVYATKGYVYGEAVQPLEAPVKEGYTFLGWDSAEPEVMPASDLTFAAQWQICQYKVSFLVDGEALSEQTQDYGTAITAPEAPVKEGYTFQGWSPEVDTVVPARDVTYEAVYTLNSYKVSYYFGDELLYEEEVSYGSPMPEYTWQPSDADIIFHGWEGETYTTMPAHDVVYKASFTDGVQAVKANAGGGNVYSLGGTQVRSTSSLQGLPAGVYVVGGKKVIKR